MTMPGVYVFGNEDPSENTQLLQMSENIKIHMILILSGGIFDNSYHDEYLSNNGRVH